jgi:hypothetical protein
MLASRAKEGTKDAPKDADLIRENEEGLHKSVEIQDRALEMKVSKMKFRQTFWREKVSERMEETCSASYRSSEAAQQVGMQSAKILGDTKFRCVNGPLPTLRHRRMENCGHAARARETERERERESEREPESQRERE